MSSGNSHTGTKGIMLQKVGADFTFRLVNDRAPIVDDNKEHGNLSKICGVTLSKLAVSRLWLACKAGQLRKGLVNANVQCNV